MVKPRDEPLFCPSTRCWTPHSNRTFLPSAIAWVREVCERFLGRLTSPSQRAVRTCCNPKNQKHTAHSGRRTAERVVRSIGRSRNLDSAPRRFPLRARGAGGGTESMQQDARTVCANLRARKKCWCFQKRRGRSTCVAGTVHRMSVIGKSPKEARTRIRAAHEPSAFAALHQHGKCFLLPGERWSLSALRTLRTRPRRYPPRVRLKVLAKPTKSTVT